MIGTLKVPVTAHYGIIRAMRRWQRIFPLFLISLLAVPALQPLFGPEFTCGFDNNFHLWRAVQIGELLREGVLYSRWAPHMAYGYGYPLFLFQSPLSAYMAAALNGVGLSWGTAVNATYALSLLLSGWAMWLLGRELWGEKGGFVAAIAYLYAPYHAYVIFNRGSLSESAAWIFPPLILWGLRRWQLRQEHWGLLTSVFGLIAMMLSHDATTYAFMPLFAAWIVAHLLLSSPPSPLTVPHRLSGFTALLLGIGGSAFFWLPAWLERSQIQFELVSASWPFRYFDNFLPPEQLFALPRNANPLLLNDWPERGLGLLLVAAAVFGFLVALRMQKGRLLVLLLGLALAGYIFLTLPLAKFIWDAIPPLAAFTPWRFLTPASMIAAVLSGALVSNWLSRQAIQIGLMLITIIILIVGHWGWFYPDRCPIPDDTTALGIIHYELNTATVGTTARQELLPVNVKRLVEPDTIPMVWYDRLKAVETVAKVQLVQGHAGLLQHEMVVEVAAPTTFQYRLLYFPGWRVMIDGTAVPLTPSDPEGWLQFTVPDGRHTLTIQFAETPAWLLADWLSLAAVLATVTLATRGRAGKRRGGGAAEQGSGGEKGWWALVGLAVILVAGKWMLVDRELVWPRQVRGVDVERPSTLTFGGPNDPAQIQLLGYQSLPNSIPADEPLALSLFWQAISPTERDYRVGLTLVDENGLRWSEEGLRDYRWSRNPLSTPFWPPDKYVQTAYLLDMLPGTPPGHYMLRLSLFDRQTLAPLTIYNEAGQAVGPWVELGQMTLTNSHLPWADVAMQYEFEACTAVPCLRGSNVDRADAAPGDTVLMTLFWLASGDVPVGFELSLMDEGGTAVTHWPITFPAWPHGLWRDQRLLQLPASLEDGSYQWQIAFADGQIVRWAELQIDAPERTLEPPNISIPVDITLNEQVTLWGAAVTEEADGLVVELVWRGERPIFDSYHVFLHLIGPDGSLLAQSDGIPASSRPTTGWLPGEYVTDVRRLPLPTTDDYMLRVGLYLPGGERLQTADGQDAITVISNQ